LDVGLSHARIRALQGYEPSSRRDALARADENGEYSRLRGRRETCSSIIIRDKLAGYFDYT
jgi:hypothetical protein